jgi:hypothetical protein
VESKFKAVHWRPSLCRDCECHTDFQDKTNLRLLNLTDFLPMIPMFDLHGRSWNGYITIKAQDPSAWAGVCKWPKALMSWSLLLVYQLEFFFRVAIPFSISIWFNDELENLVSAS